MGGLKTYFEKKLMEKLLGKKWKDKSLTLPSPIDQEVIDRCIREIEREIDSALSTQNKVKKAVKKFGKEKFKYDDAGKQTFGNGLKFEQYKKNRHAVLKVAEDEVRRMLSYRETINVIPIKDPFRREAFNQLPNRWVSYLMKTDGSPESKSFNKEAVALLALGKGLMTDEEFVEMRTDYYKTQQNMTQEEAEKAAKKENLNAPERLMKMVNDAVSDAKKKINPEQMEYDAYDIVTGKQIGPNAPTLEDKMANFWDPGVYLMWNTKDILDNDLRKMPGFQMTEEQIKNQIKENENYSGILQRFQVEVERTANPYFTVLDSYKTSEDYVGSDVPWRQDGSRPKTISQELYLEFLNAPENLQAAGMDYVKPVRDHYALRQDDIVNEIPKDFEYIVYHNRENGYTTINRMNYMKGGKIVSLDDDISPEQCIQGYANKNVQQERDSFIRAFGQWSKKNRTSRAFERMRDAMNALNGVKVSENPTPDELARIKDLYRELQIATDAYLEKKSADKERNHGHYTGKYEKKRVEFAQKLKKFADHRYERISNAKGYCDTLALEKTKSVELAQNKEWKENPKYKDLNVMQYLEAKRQEEKARQKAEKERLEREEKQRKKELEDAELLEKGKVLKGVIDPLKSDIKEPDQNYDSAVAKIENYIKEHSDKRTDSIKNNKDVDLTVDESKLVLAGITVKQMMRWENDPEKNTKPASFTVIELVNNGKINDLVEIVSSQPKFINLANLKGSLINEKWFREQMLQPIATWKIASEMMTSLKLAEKDAKIQNENVRESVVNENAADNEVKAPDRNSKMVNEEKNVRDEENSDQQFRNSITLAELEGMSKRKKAVNPSVKPADKTRNSITVKRTKTLADIQPNMKP